MSRNSVYPLGADPDFLAMLVATPVMVRVGPHGCRLVDGLGRPFGLSFPVEAAGMLGEIADAVNRKAAVAGCGPCHDGRVAGSPTPPRAEVAK